MGVLEAATSAPERAVRAFDDWQGRRSVTAVPVAVVRKYADDRGSAMAALFTHYAFLALFPLLVLLLTGLDLAIGRWPQLRQRIVETVIGQMPLLGPRLQEEASDLGASGLALVVSVAGLLWGATGLYNSAQLAMSQVWNVQGVNRMGLVSRLLRSLLLFAALFLGAAVAAAASLVGVFPDAPNATRLLSLVGAFTINIVVVYVALRIVTPPVVEWRKLLVPALLAGVAWEVLQLAGHWLVARRLSRMSDLYGVFAYAVVTLTWLTLMARVIVFSAEVSVVSANRIYPRRLAQPPLTDADREALDRIVRNERRRPEQHIDISWGDTGGDGADEGRSADQNGQVPPGHEHQQGDRRGGHGGDQPAPPVSRLPEAADGEDVGGDGHHAQGETQHRSDPTAQTDERCDVGQQQIGQDAP